jgi:xanthine dehydrogenase small subunit
VLDGDDVADIKIAYGGMAAIPKRAEHCEQALIGKTWSESLVGEAIKELDRDFSPISDMRSSAAYRRRICANLLYRFYLDTTDAAEERLYSYGR